MAGALVVAAFLAARQVAVLGGLLALGAGDDGWRAVLGVTWVVLAVLLAAKAVRERRIARRWLAAHGSEVITDGGGSS